MVVSGSMVGVCYCKVVALDRLAWWCLVDRWMLLKGGY